MHSTSIFIFGNENRMNATNCFGSLVLSGEQSSGSVYSEALSGGYHLLYFGKFCQERAKQKRGIRLSKSFRKEALSNPIKLLESCDLPLVPRLLLDRTSPNRKVLFSKLSKSLDTSSDIKGRRKTDLRNLAMEILCQVFAHPHTPPQPVRSEYL